MHRYLILIAFIITMWLPVLGQDFCIKQPTTFIDIDLQGNLFLCYRTSLSKFDSNGKLLYTYSNAILGDISSIDVGNPLRILLFYNESNTLVFLNQQLAEIGDPIDLTLLTNGEPINAAMASNGGFWLYDAASYTLNQFNNNRILMRQSENLSYLLNSEQPIYIVEQNKQVYLQTPTKVFVFDAYASLLHTLPINSPNKISIEKQSVISFSNMTFTEFNPVTHETRNKTITQYPTVKNAILFKSMLILQLESEVDIYKGGDLNEHK